jgi:hypothetical protein
LAEFSDLEALRREKRAIMEEEQRLKALLALEKAKTHGKADRYVMVRLSYYKIDVHFSDCDVIYD